MHNNFIDRLCLDEDIFVRFAVAELGQWEKQDGCGVTMESTESNGKHRVNSPNIAHSDEEIATCSGLNTPPKRDLSKVERNYIPSGPSKRKSQYILSSQARKSQCVLDREVPDTDLPSLAESGDYFSGQSQSTPLPHNIPLEPSFSSFVDNQSPISFSADPTFDILDKVNRLFNETSPHTLRRRSTYEQEAELCNLQKTYFAGLKEATQTSDQLHTSSAPAVPESVVDQPSFNESLELVHSELPDPVGRDQPACSIVSDSQEALPSRGSPTQSPDTSLVKGNRIAGSSLELTETTLRDRL